MSRELTCAVVLFPPSGQEKPSQQVQDSLERAIDYDPGPFTRIINIPLSSQDGDGSESGIHNQGVSAAREQKADWIFFLHSGESVNQDAFVVAEPSLRLFDAVWGSVSLFDGEKQIERVWKQSRLACQSYEEFFHLVLRWWIGRSHFIKTDVAQQAPVAGGDETWFQAYLLDLWQKHPCMKSAQPLTAMGQPGTGLSHAERQFILRHLDENPVYLPVLFAGQVTCLPYTGRNPVIEREQTRGAFFEQTELAYLVSRIAPGGTIVDVGANTGNHTAFFSRFANPKRVIPVEPAPHAILALTRTVAENSLGNVDLSRLGVGAGAGRGTYDLELSEGGGLGATQLKPREDGAVQVYPLDELIDERVAFIKIDVESMEMQVLEGAKTLISQYRPSIFIEIVDENIRPFLKWIDANGYRIDKVFPDKAHANYFIMPDDPGENVE